jgi:hypothetical protein
MKYIVEIDNGNFCAKATFNTLSEAEDSDEPFDGVVTITKEPN